MTTPRWRIWVDWDGDGVWGETGEDLTPEVLRLKWRWGRSLPDEHTAPARLDLELRNDGHKYSPPNAASPLAGNLQAGRRLWGRFAYPYDDFSGVNGTDPAGRSLPVGDGFSWSKQNLSSNGFQVSNGQLRAVTGGFYDALYTVNFGDADCHLGLHYRRGSNGGGGLVLRLVDAFDYLRVRFTAAATVLESVVFGWASSIRTGDALTAGVNYFIEVEMHGPSIRLFATDLDAGSVERKEILDGGGSAGNRTATRHGLWHNGASTADRWSDFGGWRSFFYGRVESIAPNPAGDEPTCRLTARDELRRLETVGIHNLISGANLRSGDVVNKILTWAGFPSGDRQLDRGRVLVANGPRALWRAPARRALGYAQEEEDGFIYLDGLGYLRLEESGHRGTGAHTAPRVTLGTATGSGPYLSGLAWEGGDDGLENRVGFRYRRLQSQGLQQVWRLREVAAIPPKATRDFLAESSAYDAVDRVRTPVSGTDYVAKSSAAGAAPDLTASLSVTLADAANFQGRGRLVRVVNNHATATAYLTLLQLRADRAYSYSEPTIYQAADGVAQGVHGLRSREIDCRFIDHYAAARDVAEARLARKKTPKPRLRLTLPPGGANLMQMVHRRLSDRVRVSYPAMGINQDFFIEQMELEAAAGEVTAQWLVQGV